MAKLPVVMLASKVESDFMVLRSVNWALDRTPDSRAIIMEFILNNLVGHVDFSGTVEVNFQRSSCTHMIAMRLQYKRTILYWGCHPGTALTLSTGERSSNFSVVD